MTLMGINLYAVFGATVVGWLFGALWYGVLGKAWLTALEMTEDDIKRPGIAGAFPFVFSFFAEMLMAFMLAGLLWHMNYFSWSSGMIAGAFCWLGFVITTMAINNAYTFRKPMLTVIDGAHFLGVLLIQGAILGAFGKG